MPFNKIILYANGSDEDKSPDLPGRVASLKADTSTITKACSTIEDMVLALKYIHGTHQSGDIQAMKIISHGTGGSLHIGSERLGINGLFRFKNMKFAEIFAAGAEIELVGCEAAAEAIGELFLAEFAPIFLSVRGGTVIGHTQGVKAEPWLTGFTFDLGRNVKAKVSVGGSVTLSGESHLNFPDLREYKSQLEDRIRVLGTKLTAQQRLMVQQRMNAAEAALGSSGCATFSNLYTASTKLDDVENLIPPLEPDDSLPLGWPYP